MIIKGKSRAGASALAAHLGNAEKNERVELLETKGTVAEDLRGALIEMEAYAAGTRCEKSLYHAAISPEPPHLLNPEQRDEAIKALETKLGFDNHARVVVLHEKEGRQHLHVVWSRIDLEHMRSVSDSHNYRKHEEVSRDLEQRFGHNRVQGAHHEREGVERPDRTPSRSELRQEERTGITGKQVKAEVTEIYRASDGADAFKAGLEDRGYLLAQGDRRDFVVLDAGGGIHSLARRIDGVRAAELRAFMKPIDRDALPNIEQAKELQYGREHGLASAYEQEKWEDALRVEAVRKYDAERREERRREKEASSDRADNALEAAYGRGDGYVSQSRAALRDHERRLQRAPKKYKTNKEYADDLSAMREEQAERAEGKKGIQSNHPENVSEVEDSTIKLTAGTEITEEMSRRLEALEKREKAARKDAAPDRQPEAPGGGHTRSRTD